MVKFGVTFDDDEAVYLVRLALLDVLLDLATVGPTVLDPATVDDQRQLVFFVLLLDATVRALLRSTRSN